MQLDVGKEPTLSKQWHVVDIGNTLGPSAGPSWFACLATYNTFPAMTDYV